MTVETELITRLNGYSGLTALVNTRIYPNKLPQNPTFPAVSYRRVSRIPNSAMGADVANVKSRFQFDVYDPDYSDARAVADQLRAALLRWGNNVIETIFFENEVEFYDDEAELHRVSCDFLVCYIQS